MKRTLLTLAILLAPFAAMAQTQQGYVKTPGRLGANSKVTPGQRIQGATIRILGSNTVLSQQQGRFSFPVTAKKFTLAGVTKSGYVLLDKEALRQYSYSSDSLIIVMDDINSYEDRKFDNEQKIRENLEKQLRRKREEINQLKQENKVTQEEYRKLIQQLNADQDNSQKLVSEMAEKYANTDFDQLDEFNIRISEYILNGELLKADSLLRSKGDLQKRTEEYLKIAKANETREQEIAQEQKELETSKAYAKKTLEDLGQDYYSRFNICKLQLKLDSAAYYITQRVELDTLNMEWKWDAAEFLYTYAINLPKVLQLLEQVKEYCIKEGNQDNISTTYNFMGMVYETQGNYATALEYLNKAMGIRKSVYGERHRDIAAIYNNIGALYKSQGDYTTALEYANKALEIKKSVYGEQHPDVALTYNNIGLLYDDLGDYPTALSYLQKALNIQKSVYGEQHPDVAMSYNNLGSLYIALGDYTTALEYFHKALDIRKAFFGEKHPAVASTYHNLGGIYSNQGNDTTALEYFHKALDIRKAFFGEQHPAIADSYTDVASTYHDIAMAYASQEDYAHAVTYFSKALEILRTVHGENDVDVATSYNNVGLAYYLQGNYKNALEYAQKAWEIRKSLFGEDSDPAKEALEIIENSRKELEQNNK